MEKRLTATAVKKAGDGKLFDGGGLMLVKKDGAGKWVYRFSHLKRRREMGLGPWPAAAPADARRLRDEWASELAAGRDPIEIRESRQADELAERSRHDPTFAEATEMVFEAKKAGLRGGGSRGRWLSPLETHILPVIGARRMSEIEKTDLHRAFKPIWREKHPTAIKALRRTRIIFRQMKLMDFPCDPFAVDAAEHMLGEVRHVETPMPSTPWQDMPALWRKLSNGSSGDMCLRWMMLTLVRLDGCAGARGAEIKDGVWTVPADRIKGREGKVKDFRVPLPQVAQDLAIEAEQFSPSDLLFPGDTGRAISSRRLELRLDQVGEIGRPHGFRSSFRSWVQDTDACAWEVSETALGHSIGNKVERAYARSDMLDRRREVMAAWAEFLTGG